MLADAGIFKRTFYIDYSTARLQALLFYISLFHDTMQLDVCIMMVQLQLSSI